MPIVCSLSSCVAIVVVVSKDSILLRFLSRRDLVETIGAPQMVPKACIAEDGRRLSGRTFQVSLGLVEVQYYLPLDDLCFFLDDDDDAGFFGSSCCFCLDFVDDNGFLDDDKDDDIAVVAFFETLMISS